MIQLFRHQGKADQNYMRFHPTPVRMGVAKNTKTRNPWKRERGLFYTAGGN